MHLKLVNGVLQASSNSASALRIPTARNQQPSAIPQVETKSQDTFTAASVRTALQRGIKSSSTVTSTKISATRKEKEQVNSNGAGIPSTLSSNQPILMVTNTALKSDENLKKGVGEKVMIDNRVTVETSPSDNCQKDKSVMHSQTIAINNPEARSMESRTLYKELPDKSTESINSVADNTLIKSTTVNNPRESHREMDKRIRVKISRKTCAEMSNSSASKKQKV